MVRPNITKPIAFEITTIAASVAKLDSEAWKIRMAYRV